MIDLKPCPFCGNDHLYISLEKKTGYDDQFQVVCNANWKGCGSSSGYWESAQDAAEAWNRRVKDE